MNRLVISLCLLFIIGCGVNSVNSKRSFEFVYEVELESSDGKKVELWLPIPQSNEVQIISDLKINTDGLRYSVENENVHNNKYLYINDPLGLSESKKVSISFKVDRLEHENVKYMNVDPNKYLGSYSTVPVGGIFDKVIAENKLSKNNMRGVYDYVFEGMHYGKPTDDQNSKNYKYIHGGKNPNTGQEWLPSNIKYGLKNKTKNELVKSQNKNSQYAYGNGNAIYACDIGVGNCTDYHSYFMSLERTLGVPARFHMGFPIPNKEDAGKVGGYHCWADYYVEGEGWYPVDISEADKDPSKKDYFFGKVDQDRFEMTVGRDFILKGYEPEITNLFIYPLLEVNDIKSSAFTKKFTYKNL